MGAGEQKFKVGDRVRVKADYGTCLLQAGGEYEILRYAKEGEPVVAVNDLGGARHELDYSDDHFELVEQPWQPKVGDRVRVTYSGWEGEGEVYALSPVNLYATMMTGKEKGNRGGFVIGSEVEPLPVAAEAQPAALTIQAGKYYRTRDGRKVGPMIRQPAGFEWYDTNPKSGHGWYDNGLIWKSGETKHESDLIAEWVDEPAAPVVATASNDNEPKSTAGFTIPLFDTDGAKLVKTKGGYGFEIARFGNYVWVDTGQTAPLTFKVADIAA